MKTDVIMDVTTSNFLNINPLNAELNPIRHLLALLRARHIIDVSSIRVKPSGAYFQKSRSLLKIWAPEG
jgi:hypothetical protein